MRPAVNCRSGLGAAESGGGIMTSMETLALGAARKREREERSEREEE